MRLALAVGGGLRPVLSRDGLVFQAPGRAAVLRYRGLMATDARGNRLPAWLSLRAGRVEIRVGDRGAQYPLRIDPFVQQGSKLVSTDGVGGAGFSVALSGDGSTALIGGPEAFVGFGGAWVFTRSGSSWSQQAQLLGSGGFGFGTAQGRSVALSADGNTALIGGDGDNNNAGAAWVFARSGSTWTQQGPKLTSSPEGANDGFGWSVALSGDGNTALIGGPGDNNQKGAAWVFTRSGSTWSQQGSKLVGTGAVGTALGEGTSVALSDDGNTALIGGPGDNNTGAAWVFARSGSTWSQQGSKLVGAGAIGAGAAEGASVALSDDGNTALIGGPGDNRPVSGAGWVFTRAGSTWSQQGPKLVGTGSVGAAQGTSVDLSGDGSTAVIGGPNDNGFVGATWVFTRSGTTWSQVGSKLVGTGAVGIAEQGRGVALSGDGSTALIGGAADNNFTGAAWVFVMNHPPTVDSFAPGAGITGSHVTITGTNLTGASSVKFGSVASSFTVVSGTEIDATVPNGAVAGPISVTTTGGAATSAQSFTPTLSITSVSPASGPFGTVVAIRGVGFTPGSAVQFNGTAATVSYVSSGEVQATVPSTATSGPVTLTNTSSPAGTVQARPSYTVTPHVAPTISSFSPGSGITGSLVTVAGTNLSGASSVKFGSVAASQFTVDSPTKLRVNVPNGAVAGAISVTTAAGTATSSQSFTPTLSITGFSPGKGPVGTVVDIHGIGFTPGSTVRFNGAAATVTYIGSGEVKATVPPNATTGQITLTNTGSPAGTVHSAKKYGVT